MTKSKVPFPAKLKLILFSVSTKSVMVIAFVPTVVNTVTMTPETAALSAVIMHRFIVLMKLLNQNYSRKTCAVFEHFVCNGPT